VKLGYFVMVRLLDFLKFKYKIIPNLIRVIE
jgi:hypothetical protein